MTTVSPLTMLLLLSPLILLDLGLKAYCLYKLSTAQRVAHLPKWAWALIILCVSPFGWIGWLLLGQADDA